MKATMARELNLVIHLGPSKAWALAIYAVLFAAFLASVPDGRLARHTRYNHHALQAEAWLAGRLDLGGPPPAYTGRNDFAVFEGKTYVSFPPVPALILAPALAAVGAPERLRDAQIWLALAPLGPVLWFLGLERLRKTGRSRRPSRVHAGLALLLGVGSVYWFSAVQGSVWFASHVVATTLAGGYFLASVAGRPALAGLALALAVGARPSLGFALPYFVFEALRDRPAAGLLTRRLLTFALPMAIVLSLLGWHNAARFGDPTEFGHRYLDVVWRPRIEAHGLFSPIYLGRNLAVMATALPFYDGDQGLRVGGHGLALWITSPFLAWALWPRRRSSTFLAAAFSAGLVTVVVLLYQNTGWVQFGYRFSNDFAPFLIVMIAVGGRRLGAAFWLAGVVAIAINAIGAVTFDNPRHASFYVIDRDQRTLFQAP
jgi:hypothetical protein